MITADEPTEALINFMNQTCRRMIRKIFEVKNSMSETIVRAFGCRMHSGNIEMRRLEC
jgi:hypothetical protein